MDTRRGDEPHVVIIGGGFAGMEAAKALRDAPVRVTLVDRTNHHLFQPLLYQVATSLLSASDTAMPIRSTLRHHANTTVLMADVKEIVPTRRTVIFDDGRVLHYDFLIVATGARHSYFGNAEWEASAPGLKTVDDALDIRRRLLLAFEDFEAGKASPEGAEAPTIVVIGGGPTGVELAATLPEMIRHTLARDFRKHDARRARVVLLERAPRILSTFDERLSERAHRDLCALGVEVRTNVAVTRVQPDAVYLGAECIPSTVVLWAAGNEASPLGRQLASPVDRSGRVIVAADLSVPSHPEIFVAGDLASVSGPDGPIPAVATSANQMGRHAAANVLATIAGRARTPFVFRPRGNMAVVGRGNAVAQIGRFQLTGGTAFLLWAAVHLFYVAGHRNRGRVLSAWLYALFTRERGDRVITDAGRAVA